VGGQLAAWLADRAGRRAARTGSRLGRGLVRTAGQAEGSGGQQEQSGQAGPAAGEDLAGDLQDLTGNVDEAAGVGMHPVILVRNGAGSWERHSRVMLGPGTLGLVLCSVSSASSRPAAPDGGS